MDSPSTLILIGGAVALLCYKSSRYTLDIDSFSSITEQIRTAHELAVNKTGLNIPLSQSAVADAPYNFEDRLINFSHPSIKKLTILVPSIYDLILMKVVRGSSKDVFVIKEIIEKNSVDLNRLISLFEDEMGHVVGSHSTINLNFASVIESCFGERYAEDWLSKQK